MLLTERGLWKVITDATPDPVTNTWSQLEQKAHTTIALNVDDNQIHHIRDCEIALDA